MSATGGPGLKYFKTLSTFKERIINVVLNLTRPIAYDFMNNNAQITRYPVQPGGIPCVLCWYSLDLAVNILRNSSVSDIP